MLESFKIQISKHWHGLKITNNMRETFWSIYTEGVNSNFSEAIIDHKNRLNFINDTHSYDMREQLYFFLLSYSYI